jgi:hypothetical protein
MKRWLSMGAIGALARAAAVGEEVPAHVFWEAEGAAESTFPASTWLAPANDRERDALSGGGWLTRAEASAEGPSAAYAIEVPEAGRYDLWVRAFGATAMRWRFDGGEWQTFDGGQGVGRLALDIRGDRYLAAAWFRVGAADLRSGAHRFEFALADAPKPATGLDAFLLIRAAFHPRGARPPGGKYGRAPDGWFPFEPDRDGFAPSPLDLSHLNEAEAGSRGRVTRRGDRLVFEKTGEEVRFWGVTACSPVWMMDPADMDYLARRLAKHGVNAVRLHAAPYYETGDGPQTRGIHALVAALKRRGIYVGINWYCSACNHASAAWGVPALEEGKFPFGHHFFHEPTLERYRSWGRNLLAARNPHTGLSLAEDPAVAFVELIDEDNLFFYTFAPERMNPATRPELERRFGNWAARRYGSVEKALDAWGTGPAPKYAADASAEGRLALYSAALLGGADWAAAQRNPRRAGDQLRFMVELSREFYAGMRDWLRRETGYAGLVVGTNWKTADERVLGPLDKYADMTLDLTARNTYFADPTGPTRFHPWNVGMAYRDASLLLAPEQGLTMHVQYNDWPHLMTEGGYSMPNRFRTEEPLLMASCASLQGIDGLFPFVVEGDTALMMNKWPIQTAATMGQYPAAALIYRLGYAAEAPVVVREALRLDDLYAFRGAAGSQPLGLDDIQSRHVPEGADVERASGEIDPLAFYVGRVVRDVAENPGPPVLAREALAGIDRAAKTVRSATGEVRLDYGRGLLTLDSARAQGAAGFLAAAGAIELGVLRIASGNEYGAVVLVSLDGQPLDRSRRMLLQAMTEERNFGWETKPVRVPLGKGGGTPEDALEITDLGGPPIVVRDIAGDVRLRRSDAAALQVTALDFNGSPLAPAGTADGFRLRRDALYYVVEPR